MIEFNLKAKDENIGAKLLGTELLMMFDAVQPAGLSSIGEEKFQEIMVKPIHGKHHDAWSKIIIDMLEDGDWEEVTAHAEHGLSIIEKPDVARIYFCWNPQMWERLTLWNSLLLYMKFPPELMKDVVHQLWKMVVAGYKCVKHEGQIVLKLGKYTEAELNALDGESPDDL